MEYVWFAFLHYGGWVGCALTRATHTYADNEEYPREQWCRDYRVLPVNYVTTLCNGNGSDVFHVQVLFWDARARAYVTYSVNASVGHVHASDTKQFTARGWTFTRCPVTPAQAQVMRAFCVAQLGRPFNAAGLYWLHVWPRASDGSAWFCSELCAAALLRAGLLPARAVEPGAVSPAALYALLHAGAAPLGRDVPHPLRSAGGTVAGNHQQPNLVGMLRF